MMKIRFQFMPIRMSAKGYYTTDFDVFAQGGFGN